jgi:hypothetical protein
MANRVLIGKRGSSDYGLFVSKPGDDVLTTTNALAFDSRAASDLKPIGYGQGSVSAHTPVNGGSLNLMGVSPKTYYTNNTSAAQVARVAHNQSFTPLVAVRWTYDDDLDGSNRANITFPPMISLSYLNALDPGDFTQFPPTPSTPKANTQIGHGFDFEIDSTYLYFLNYECGMRAYNTSLTNRTVYSGRTIYYAYVIFDTPNIGVKI